MAVPNIAIVSNVLMDIKASVSFLALFMRGRNNLPIYLIETNVI